MRKIKPLILLLVFIQSCLFAQQKTGNIVEYFGKEKIETIQEGKLIHVFKKALTLKVPTYHFNSSSFPKDPVYARFLEEENYLPNDQETFDIDFVGNSMVWKNIKVDNTNSFNDQSLSSSYVLLKYKSNKAKTVLFEASGHSLVLINGLPHEGDHYDFGWNLIPLELKKGMNVFVLKVGRFPRIRARLIEPKMEVQLTTRDVLVPDVLFDETKEYIGGIRVVNSTSNWVKGYTLQSGLKGEVLETKVPDLAPMSVLKMPFSIASVADDSKVGTEKLTITLKNNNTVLDSKEVEIQIKSKHQKIKRTFISDIDGSVQYYSVAPSSNKDLKNGAFFLSVHGASVEAVNQANAYKQKDWGNLVAPTNRRPFGFAWEDWGRLDALEVMSDAKNIYQPDPQKIYLTGHSMGGHGTWYLGATYPDKFAAIAPCAGYPDLLLYRDGFLKSTLELPQAELSKRGMSPEMVSRLKFNQSLELTPVEKMIERAGTPSRTLELIRNYLQVGVYLLHGEKDNVVPTSIARGMRKRLGTFHNDFVYYEYPDGTHWYGDHSIDWEPLFNFFKRHTIKKDDEIKNLEFYTGSPGVSASSNFVTIYQQEIPFKTSSFNFSKEEEDLSIKTNNVALLMVDFSKLTTDKNEIKIDESIITINKGVKMYFHKVDGVWKNTSIPSLSQKGPHRNGGFKDAFRNNVVFVYATKGTEVENEWYLNRARFDAETFWYRANGKIELVKDVDFSLKKYADRNVVIYGNKSNNAAWKTLLKKSPIQVENNKIDFDGKSITGNQWGMYFIVPRTDSDIASIGVVTATGIKGMKAAYMNHYLVNGTTFPDVLLFDDEVLKNGMSAVKASGFFGNDWSVEQGDFEWK